MLLAACNAIGHDGLLSRQRRTFMHASNLNTLLGFLLLSIKSFSAVLVCFIWDLGSVVM